MKRERVLVDEQKLNALKRAHKEMRQRINTLTKMNENQRKTIEELKKRNDLGFPTWFLSSCSEEMRKAINVGPSAFCSYMVRHPREFRVNGPRAAGISVAEDEGLERQARDGLRRLRELPVVDLRDAIGDLHDVAAALVQARWGTKT